MGEGVGRMLAFWDREVIRLFKECHGRGGEKEMRNKIRQIKNLMGWFANLSLWDKLFLYETIKQRDQNLLNQQMQARTGQQTEKQC